MSLLLRTSLAWTLACVGCVSTASTSAPEPSPPAPPASMSAAAAASAEPVQSAPVPSAGPASAPAAAGSAPAASAASSAEPPAPPPVAEPQLLAEDGSVLPQTEDRPTTQSPLFEHHTRLLLDAILRDDPSLAKPFFFPVQAYEQIKAIAKPARDWQHRLWKNFERDVHQYHAELGAAPQGAMLDRIDVREQAARWMKPNSEGNRIGYFRVTRSTIHGKKANGAPIRLELTSLISWRGEWYVVHLHGFR